MIALITPPSVPCGVTLRRQKVSSPSAVLCPTQRLEPRAVAGRSRPHTAWAWASRDPPQRAQRGEVRVPLRPPRALNRSAVILFTDPVIVSRKPFGGPHVITADGQLEAFGENIFLHLLNLKNSSFNAVLYCISIQQNLEETLF